jgi:DNA-binding MarR family transcriptional regulator
MAKRKKPKLGYDQWGGVLAVSRRMLESKAYESMPATTKALMQLLQVQWRNEKPVAYGVREAGQRIGCTPSTASKAFKTFIERGFIICDTSLYSTAIRAARRGNGC